MNAPLYDPLRVRALERAVRRARSRAWWKRARRTSSPASASVTGRLLFTLIAGGAGVAAAAHPLALHLLALWGLVTLSIRLTKLRELLFADPALARLAQLPVTDASIFDYQLRRFGRGGLPAALDAAAFWFVALAQRPDPVPWAAVLVAAIGYALATEVLAFLVLFRARGLGFAWIAVVLAAFAVAQRDELPWLWNAAEPLLHAAAWLTPWGWLGALVTYLPSEPWWGLAVLAFAIVALLALRWARARARNAFVLHPAWRELAGRPRQASIELDGDHDVVPNEPSAPSEHDRAPKAEEDIAQALAEARLAAPGESVRALGWAGRQACSRWNGFERTLADLLAPEGADDTQWRLALLLAVLVAAPAVAGISPFWSLAVLGVIALVRRLPVAAVLILALLGLTLIWPGLTTFVCLVAPCVLAVLLAVPLLGGRWSGLPMGSSLLGSVPRSWAAMMRIMVGYTGWRLLAGTPVVALVAIALAHRLGRPLGAGIAAGFVFIAISTPWLCALKLVQRTGGDVQISLGRAWLTLSSVLCTLAHLLAAALLVAGASAGAAMREHAGMFAGAGLALALAASALHVVLLRYAYRRRIDLVVRA